MPENNEEQKLPHCGLTNLETEKALLGGLIQNNDILDSISEFLMPEHFALPENSKLYSIILSSFNQGNVADEITLRSYVENNDKFAGKGGRAYLYEIMSAAADVSKLIDYALTIYDLHIKRELLAVCHETTRKCVDSSVTETALGLVEFLETQLYDFATASPYFGGFAGFKNSLGNAFAEIEDGFKHKSQNQKIVSGFDELDRIINGFVPGELITLAGLSNVGKTFLAANICFASTKPYLGTNSEKGVQVGYFSLDKPDSYISKVILAIKTRICLKKILEGNLSEHEFETLCDAKDELEQLPIYIDDTPDLLLSSIRTRARRLKRHYGLDLVVIDFLQHISVSPDSLYPRNNNETAKIVKALKQLSLELDIPVILLVQLAGNSDAPSRTLFKLYDLAKYDPLRRVSDTVIFIGKSDENVIDVQVAKQRHGNTGIIQLNAI